MNDPRAQAIVVGASAGAVEALSAILPTLAAGYPLPVMIVVHLPAGQKSALAELLRARCRLDVHEAEDKEPIRPGTVYFAPPDYHLLVEADRRLSLSSEEPVHYSRPSIGVLFETAADAYESQLVGIILTGANGDGARGLRAIRDAGGTALVQRPDLAYAPAMPRAAIEACPDARALGLDEIAAYLMEVGSDR
jgi:two-component system chemotaxis response regulator CheB